MTSCFLCNNLTKREKEAQEGDTDIIEFKLEPYNIKLPTQLGKVKIKQYN